MLKDITLGQYYPTESAVHRADPRTKLLLATVYIVALFVAKNIWGFLFAAAALLLCVRLSRIPLRTILCGLKAVMFILVFTALINIFLTKGEHLLFSWRFINIYREGIYTAIFMAFRIIMLIMGTGLFLTYTTTPIMLTNGLEYVLSPLKVFGVQVHEFAMMMSTALRFIPSLMEDTDRIMDAQKARGASFSSGGLIAKAKALIPILIPLFVCAFKRADDLSVAMECRCYRGGKGRTKMTVMRFSAADWLWTVLAVLFVVAIVFLNRIPAGFTL
ncbi:MAG: energy-coupling factor transporter transmembrane protein EcfT [Clostridia bacterium]|nr:energy-coupling factor transporter transmembrane protein EcfT [Clostridia bacterium]